MYMRIYTYMCFFVFKTHRSNDGNPYRQRKTAVVSSPLHTVDLGKSHRKKQAATKTQNPSTHLQLIRRVSSLSSTDCIRSSDGGSQESRAQQRPKPRKEVPQTKEQDIGESGVDAIAATQGPAEQ